MGATQPEDEFGTWHERVLRHICLHYNAPQQHSVARDHDGRIQEVLRMLERISPRQRRATSALLNPIKRIRAATPWLPKETPIARHVPCRRLAESLFGSFRTSRFGRNRLPDHDADPTQQAMAKLLSRVSFTFLHQHLHTVVGDDAVAEQYGASLSGFLLTESVNALTSQYPLDRAYLDAMLDCYQHGVHLLGLNEEGSLEVEANDEASLWKELDG